LDSEEQVDLLDVKLLALKDELFAKKKNTTLIVSKNISNCHDLAFDDLSMFPFKRKQLEDLPVSKEVPNRKKTKPATSRKNSVGKIVHQPCAQQKEAKDKENSQHIINSKPKAKEKAYKDIIKEKLLDDKFADKVPLSLSTAPSKAKTDRRRD
jgi:hypothetical protein